MNEMEKQKQEKYKIGLIVLGLLALFTVGEFVISVTGNNWVAVFVVIALIKAFLVLREYMHIGRLFGGPEEHP